MKRILKIVTGNWALPKINGQCDNAACGKRSRIIRRQRGMTSLIKSCICCGEKRQNRICLPRLFLNPIASFGLRYT